MALFNVSQSRLVRLNANQSHMARFNVNQSTLKPLFSPLFFKETASAKHPCQLSRKRTLDLRPKKIISA